jgi:hypothetical protein
MAGVRAWNPRTGSYVRGGAVWGPRGSAGFVGAYNPRTDGAGYLAGGRNVYGAWKSAGVSRGSDWARATARSNAAGGSSLRWNTSAGQGFVREGRRGDIYAGRNGNVYRNTGNGWQTFDGGWHDVARPERGELLENREGLRDLSPEARERLQERGGGDALRGMAGAGAAGAAGAALGQRLSGREQTVRDRADGGVDRGRAQERVAQRPATEQMAARQRPAAKERPATQKPAAQQRPAAQRRPTVHRPATRPAVGQPLPSNLTRDMQSRNLGNQRQIASRQFSRQPASFAPQRSFGGGGFGGGRSFGGGGFGGGRGGFGGGRGGRR